MLLIAEYDLNNPPKRNVQDENASDNAHVNQVFLRVLHVVHRNESGGQGQ